MKRVLTTQQMKEADAYTIRQMGIPSLVLMERAALACVSVLKQEFPLQKTLVLCGSGNNGGDGLAIARMLHLEGYDVAVYLTGNDAHRSEENKTQLQIAKNYGTPFVKKPGPHEYTTIVDSVLGIGLSRVVSEEYAALFRLINESRSRVLAVDIPSGIQGNTGQVLGEAIRADATVSFAYAKPGVLLYPGAAYAGRLLICDIGIYPSTLEEKAPSVWQMERSDAAMLPLREAGGHKGTFGKALLIAGGRRMCGAAYLSAMACFRMGAGMVKIHTAEENRVSLQQLLPEAMLSVYSEEQVDPEMLREDIEWADVIGIGPGIGTTPVAAALLEAVLEQGKSRPVVIDADGLNLLSRDPELLRKLDSPCIVTPHLGEMSRLAGISVSEIRKDRLKTAAEFASRYQVVCVQKDARTVTAEPRGELVINSSGNSGMATAGSGDVLTGMILGLLAQGMPAPRAAALGVYLHGCAGDRAAARLGEAAVMAGSLLEELPGLLQEINGRR